MRQSDIRFLSAYDCWATTKVLDAAEGIDGTTWSSPNAIGERGLGGILVHLLGAQLRWRHELSHSPGDRPRPEAGRLPTVDELRAAFATEWLAYEAWLVSLDDATIQQTEQGIPYWQMLAHVVNHGTQHRAEAAALLTAAGHSPGDLDLIRYAEALARAST